jgi:glycosyltransferase involved in cell wall biosynthesis
VGNIVKRKGIEEFIRSYVILKSEFKDLRGYVIGKGSEKYIKTLADWIRMSGFVDDLNFPGQIRHEEIVELYSNGGVFCLPSYTENCPNAVMEAMAAGLPVVASRVGDVGNIVACRNSGILVERKNIDALVDAISVLLREKELFLTYGKRGRGIANARWRPEIIAQKHIEMYKDILSK